MSNSSSSSPRVFVDFTNPELVPLGSEIELPETDSHHLRDVLRLEEGARVVAVCRSSATQYQALISSLEKAVRIKILSAEPEGDTQGLVASLIFALAKGKKNDLVCEKACELGVDNVILWQADRSILRIRSESDRVSKLSRFKRVIEAAAKQSRRNRIPRVELALNLDSLFSILNALRSPGDELLSCSLSPSAMPFRAAAPDKGRAHILIGPEGDLTQAEENILVDFGFKLVSLGPTTLRCETAAIAAISAAQIGWS